MGICSYQFQWRRFGFEDCNPNRFHTFWWSKCRAAFLVYRSFLLVFHTAWFVAAWVMGKSKFYFALSNWSMLYTFIYLVFAFITAAYGYLKQERGRKNSQVPLNYSNDASEESCVREKEGADVNQNDISLEDEGELRWFHKVTWLFHSVAMDTTLFVTILYWVAVFPSEKPDEVQPVLGMAKHALNCGMMLIDLALVGFPVRFLHAIYMVIASGLYSIYLVILHATGLESAVYGFIDFEKDFARALGVLAASSFVGAWVLQAISFTIYQLRDLVSRKCIVRRNSALPT